MNAIRKFDLKAIVACVIVFGIVQGLLFGEIIGPFWELNIILICINIILAVSLNLINGYTGQFSIGHAGFMAVGAYTSAIMTVKLGMPFEAGLIAATLAAGLLGFLIGLPTLRLDGDYLAIATLGLGEIIRICILNIDYVGGASGLMGIPRMTNFAYTFWIMIAIIFFIKNFKNSSYGRCCLAIRENEIAADTMGINTTKYKVMAFTFGAAFAGTAGALFSHYFFLAHPASFTFIRYSDHGCFGRSWFYDRCDYRCNLVDLHFRLFVGLPGMAYDYLFCYYDYPDAVPSARLVRQQGIELENV